jgi:hypothetical protein
MTRIIFPLATNIKSLQRWGDNDISKRIKQSLILYDKIIVETGTYNFEGADAFVLQGYAPWSDENSKEAVTGKIEQVENRQEDGYIKVVDGITRLEKYRYKVEKKDEFIADYRIVDVISEIESGKYGKVDLLEYLGINRYGDYLKNIQQNTAKDLSDKEFAEAVATVHGRMPTVVFLNNLNDSLAISHATNMPVAVDSIYASLLKLKTKCRIGRQFSVLERLSQIGVPDFSELTLEQIVDLRKDKALTSFRNLISILSSRLQSETNFNLEAFFTQELLKQIKELAPNRKRVALSIFLGALSKVPCPFISEAKTIADISKKLKEHRDFSSNWVSFVLKLNQLDS